MFRKKGASRHKRVSGHPHDDIFHKIYKNEKFVKKLSQ